MPPRHAYWTILIDNQPTAFRASEVDDLRPTFNRLKEKHSQTVMKWYERGKLWETRDEAQRVLRQGYDVWSGGRLAPPKRSRSQERSARAVALPSAPKPEGDMEPPAPSSPDTPDPVHEPREARSRSWRPGGEHRDPREKYELAKKAKWQRLKLRMRGGERPFERDRGTPSQHPSAHEGRPPSQGSEARKSPWRPARPRDERPGADRSRPHTPPPRDGGEVRPSSTRSPGSRPSSSRPPSAWSPGARPQGWRPPGTGPRTPAGGGERYRGPGGKGPGKPRGPR